MKLLAKVGLIIFAFGIIYSAILFAEDYGTQIHLQTYFHPPLVGSTLDWNPYILFFTLGCIPIGLILVCLKTNKIELKRTIKFFAIIFLIAGLAAGLAFGAAIDFMF